MVYALEVVGDALPGTLVDEVRTARGQLGEELMDVLERAGQRLASELLYARSAGR